jgi:hypothetical protein
MVLNGFKDCDVVHSASLSDGFSFYVAYRKDGSFRGLIRVRGDEASAKLHDQDE